MDHHRSRRHDIRIVRADRDRHLMMETGVLTKDVGTILVGQEAVEEGIICEVAYFYWWYSSFLSVYFCF